MSEGIRQIKVELPANPAQAIASIADILARQVRQRCGATVTPQGDAPLRVELAVESGSDAEGFRIQDSVEGTVRIVGNESRGLLYGVGKFLRECRFAEGVMLPSAWRGTSRPACPFRAVYLATHFRNYYEAAPLEDVLHYVEDLALWGYNTILLHYPTWQFAGVDDAKAQEWLRRFRAVLRHAKRYGLSVGLLQVPNQGYATSPETFRGTPVPGHTRGNHGINLCPSNPDAWEYLLGMHAELLDRFSGVGLDYYVSWPYDEGGCGCARCWPWGARGFVARSKAIVALVRDRFPACRVVLSTWCFDNEDDGGHDGEWVGLAKALSDDGGWVDYIMADGHDDYFPAHLLEKGIPGGLPLLNFPEISMFGMCPWGGFGANPAPAHFQGLWNRIKHVARGGAPYSEGVYEDMNKAIVAGLYWEPDRAAEDIVREYCAFEFSPEVADDLVEVTRIFERNHDRKRIGADTVRALELVQGAEPAMTKAARRSWRWRIFHLRALIDKELHERQGQMAGTVLESAFDELTGIYHAQGVHTAPLRPPQVQAESGDGEKRA